MSVIDGEFRSLCFPLVVRAFQEYAEPEDANPASPQRRAPTAGEDEAVVLPLSENTLTHNLGIPVLIVCTKVQNKTFFFFLHLWSLYTPQFPSDMELLLATNRHLTLLWFIQRQTASCCSSSIAAIMLACKSSRVEKNGWKHGVTVSRASHALHSQIMWAIYFLW